MVARTIFQWLTFLVDNTHAPSSFLELANGKAFVGSADYTDP